MATESTDAIRDVGTLEELVGTIGAVSAHLQGAHRRRRRPQAPWSGPATSASRPHPLLFLPAGGLDGVSSSSLSTSSLTAHRRPPQKRRSDCSMSGLHTLRQFSCLLACPHSRAPYEVTSTGAYTESGPSPRVDGPSSQRVRLVINLSSHPSTACEWSRMIEEEAISTT